jgi:hypothetical protein
MRIQFLNFAIHIRVWAACNMQRPKTSWVIIPLIGLGPGRHPPSRPARRLQDWMWG